MSLICFFVFSLRYGMDGRNRTAITRYVAKKRLSHEMQEDSLLRNRLILIDNCQNLIDFFAWKLTRRFRRSPKRNDHVYLFVLTKTEILFKLLFS